MSNTVRNCSAIERFHDNSSGKYPTRPCKTRREVSQNSAVGVGYLPVGEESYTLSYTGKVQDLLAFSLSGVGNVGFFQKLFLRGEGWSGAWLCSSGLPKTFCDAI